MTMRDLTRLGLPMAGGRGLAPLAAPQDSARIPDRIGQHGVKLTLGELPGLLRDRLGLGLRHHPVHRTLASRRERWSSRRHRHDPRVGRRWLVTPLVAHALQLGAHCVAAMAQSTCDLTGTVARGPEFFEQCYVFRIPTHGRCLYTEYRIQESRC